MHFEFEQVDHWPPLAWAARCTDASSTVQVWHGPRVETAPAHFSEAVWDGPFAEGALDETDVVFGSGARVRGDVVTFVSSCASTDRLQYVVGEGATYVSNSLACLLGLCGLQPDPSYPHYYRDLGSVRLGIDRYERDFPTASQPAHVVFTENLRWDGHGLERVSKLRADRDFSSYAAYRRFLDDSLRALADNLADGERRHPYRMMGTLSSGYDTTAVVSLLRPLGLDEAVSISTARSGKEDSGTEAARHLRLRLHVVDREAWRQRPLPEVPFLAADAKGEDIHLSGAGSLLAGCVVFTGYAGGSVWDRAYFDPSRGPLARGDRSGLSLMEYRLWAGFIAAAVPFLGALQKEAIQAIGTSEEMEPWHVEGGYSRPVARRIAEEAGVPRHAFGREKKAASVLIQHKHRDLWSALSPDAYRDFASWVLDKAHAGALRHSEPEVEALLARQRRWGGLAAAAESVLEALPEPLSRGWRVVIALRRRTHSKRLSPYLFLWAMDRAIDRYRPVPHSLAGAPHATAGAPHATAGAPHATTASDVSRSGAGARRARGARPS